MDENGLYDFHQEMVAQVKTAGESFNWHCDLDIPVTDINRVAMLDVSEEAAQWRQKNPAPDMYFSHGEYYEDGIQHIIDELTLKPTSNRALYSLLAQRDITGSGDGPIPSFLTFQCSIERGVLYCTASFRAQARRMDPLPRASSAILVWAKRPSKSPRVMSSFSQSIWSWRGLRSRFSSGGTN